MMRPSLFVTAIALLCGLSCCAPPPDRAAGIRPLNGVTPPYPISAAEQGLEGDVAFTCTITETGSTRDCSILSATDPVFVPGTLSFLSRARYAPAIHDGVPVADLHRRWTVRYRIDTLRETIDARCDVRPDGSVQRCHVANGAAPQFWPLAKAVLERLSVVPHDADGQTVADPDRPVRVAVNLSRLPSAGANALPGDLRVSRLIGCDGPLLGPDSGERRCRLLHDDGTHQNAATVVRYRLDLGIAGMVAQPNGEFGR